MTVQPDYATRRRRVSVKAITEKRASLVPAADAPEGRRLNDIWEILGYGGAVMARDLLLKEPPGLRRDRLLRFAERMVQGGFGENDDIAVAPATGEGREILVIFSGSGYRFSVQHNMFERDDVHVVLIRDLKACFSMAGLQGLGADYHASKLGLGDLLDALSTEEESTEDNRLPVHALGISTGGYAALRFGLDMGFHRVTVFGAPGTIRLEDDDTASMERYPELVPIGHCAPEQIQSAIDLYKAKNATLARGAVGEGLPQVLTIHGELHERDARWSRGIGTIPGARVMELPGVDNHHVFNLLCANGQLRDLVEPKPMIEEVAA